MHPLYSTQWSMAKLHDELAKAVAAHSAASKAVDQSREAACSTQARHKAIADKHRRIAAGHRSDRVAQVEYLACAREDALRI